MKNASGLVVAAMQARYRDLIDGMGKSFGCNSGIPERDPCFIASTGLDSYI